MARSVNRAHPPSVYRRRRLAVFLVLLLVVGGVWMAVAQPWKDGGPLSFLLPASESASPEPSKDGETAPPAVVDVPDPSGEPSPSTSASSSPTPKATPTLGPCDPAVLTVEALTDKQSYGANEKPGFSIRLTNTGGVDCTLDVGTATQRFVVTSGADVWWNSQHCQKDSAAQVVVLAAGKTVQTTTPLVWDRTRSAKNSCDAKNRAQAGGGGASYHLAVEIGGVPAEATRQFFLH